MNGQNAYTAPAGPSSSSSITGDHIRPSHTQAQQNTLPDGQHSAVICDHLWKNGWQRGLYSDVEVRVRNRPYMLHKIVLSKSPYMVHLLNSTPLGHPIWIEVPNDPMYEEAVAIVLGYLYASHVLSAINASNARSVLHVASNFGVPDLCPYAYDVCRQSINADTIQEWVEWIDLQEPKVDQVSVSSSRASTPQSLPADGRYVNGTGPSPAATGGDGMSFGTAPTLALPTANGPIRVPGNSQKKVETTDQPGPPTGWKDVLSQPVDNFTTQLKQDIYTYLTVQLPEELQQDPQFSTLNDNAKFKEVFSRLPFDLFKACIEDSQLKLGTDQERFAFAKSMIQLRKRKAAARTAQGLPDAASVVENVVLRFGGGSGSKVHITRKSKQRSLWKVDKE